MIGQFLITLIYVLLLGIALPRKIVEKFPHAKKTTVITTSFFLLLFSSFPGAFITIIFHYGLDYFLAITSEITYLIGASIGFGFFTPFPPFGYGWLAAILSLLGFYLAYKDQRINSKNMHIDSLESKSEVVEDFAHTPEHVSSPEKSNISGKLKQEVCASDLPVQNKKSNLFKSRIKTPIRRFIFLLLVPLTICYAIAFVVVSVEGYLSVSDDLIIKDENSKLIWDKWVEERERCYKVKDECKDVWVENYGFRKGFRCNEFLLKACENREKYAPDFYEHHREIKLSDAEFWKTWFDFGYPIFVVLPLVFVCWLFVLGRLEFLGRYFRLFYRYTFKGIYSYIRYGQWFKD